MKLWEIVKDACYFHRIYRLTWAEAWRIAAKSNRGK